VPSLFGRADDPANLGRIPAARSRLVVLSFAVAFTAGITLSDAGSIPGTGDGLSGLMFGGNFPAE
jgi:hypothetical protein